MRLVADLRQLDDNLTQSGLEDLAIHFGLSQLPLRMPRSLGAGKKAEIAVYSNRVGLLRHLLGLPGFKAYSMTLASSDRLTDGCRSLLGVKTSKSSLHRASKFFTMSRCASSTHGWLSSGNQRYCSQLGVEQAIFRFAWSIRPVWRQTHFPVDWALLSEVTRTLLKAVKIRREALLQRMPDSRSPAGPYEQALYRDDAYPPQESFPAKARKKILRKMKRLLKRIGAPPCEPQPAGGPLRTNPFEPSSCRSSDWAYR